MAGDPDGQHSCIPTAQSDDSSVPRAGGGQDAVRDRVTEQTDALASDMRSLHQPEIAQPLQQG